jgi:hypothetical protein
MKKNKIFLLLLISTSLFSCKDIRKEYYPNGTLSSEIEVEGDIMDGVGKWYYENGKLKKEIIYINGKEQGKAKWYHANGNVKIEAIYKNGEENGVFKEYYETGELWTVVEFKNGKQDGLLEEIYPNKSLKSELFYVNGIKHGKFISYYSNGKLEMDASYEMDSVNYYILNDSLGNFVEEFRRVEVNVPDTLIIGQEYEFTTVFKGPKGESLEGSSYSCRNDMSEDFFSDKSNLKFHIDDNTISYLFAPDEIGKWEYQAWLELNHGEANDYFHRVKGTFWVVEKEESTAMN